MARFAVWVAPVSGTEALPTVEETPAAAGPVTLLTPEKVELTTLLVPEAPEPIALLTSGAAKAGEATASVNMLAVAKVAVILLNNYLPPYLSFYCCIQL